MEERVGDGRRMFRAPNPKDQQKSKRGLNQEDRGVRRGTGVAIGSRAAKTLEEGSNLRLSKSERDDKHCRCLNGGRPRKVPIHTCERPDKVENQEH